MTITRQAIAKPSAKNWGRQSADSSAASVLFVETYGAKYERAIKKLTKDCDVLLTFSDFPGENWERIRATNPIESVFANVRNRTCKTKGYLSIKIAVSKVLKPKVLAKMKWRQLSGTNKAARSCYGGEFQRRDQATFGHNSEIKTAVTALLVGQRTYPQRSC